jgi:DNA-binding transcriptional LysR family regulator
MDIPASVLLTRLKSRLKLRHLQALLALYDLRSMGRAAQATGMTQPAMSQLVAEMERLLDAQLFLRHSKGVDPTPAALDLIPIAHRIVDATEEAAERIASRRSRESGLVRVAATAATEGAIMDIVLPAFAARHPDVIVQVSTVLGLSLDAAFAGDEYDVVCCRARPVLPDGWSFEVCVLDEMVPVCGTSNQLAHQKTVTIAELGRATWLQNHVATGARASYDELVAREGWTNVTEVHIHSRVGALVWSMLRNGDYVTLVPRSVVAPWLRAGLLCELPVDLNLKLEPLGFLWRADNTGQATRHFLRALREIGDADGGAEA